jgi:predicted phage tail protein
MDRRLFLFGDAAVFGKAARLRVSAAQQVIRADCPIEGFSSFFLSSQLECRSRAAAQFQRSTASIETLQTFSP